MLKKIEFMADVGEHENIVQFIASCSDGGDGTLDYNHVNVMRNL